MLNCTRFPPVAKRSPGGGACPVVLTGMRSLMLDGWNGGDLLPAVAACLLLALAMYGLAGYALRVRTRRK